MSKKPLPRQAKKPLPKNIIAKLRQQKAYERERRDKSLAELLDQSPSGR